MSKVKIKARDLPADLLEFVRKIWNEGAERAIWQDGDRYIMDTTLQHVEFTPFRKTWRMQVWGRDMDTKLFEPAIDRLIV